MLPCTFYITGPKVIWATSGPKVIWATSVEYKANHAWVSTFTIGLKK